MPQAAGASVSVGAASDAEQKFVGELELVLVDRHFKPVNGHPMENGKKMRATITVGSEEATILVSFK